MKLTERAGRTPVNHATADYPTEKKGDSDMARARAPLAGSKAVSKTTAPTSSAKQQTDSRGTSRKHEETIESPQRKRRKIEAAQRRRQAERLSISGSHATLATALKIKVEPPVSISHKGKAPQKKSPPIKRETPAGNSPKDNVEASHAGPKTTSSDPATGHPAPIKNAASGYETDTSASPDATVVTPAAPALTRIWSKDELNAAAALCGMSCGWTSEDFAKRGL